MPTYTRGCETVQVVSCCYGTAADSFTPLLTNKHHAWVSGNGWHADGVKLFAVNTYYQLKERIDKRIRLLVYLSDYVF